jgi:phosphatidylserine/phosphatidylglycerophosphate/cardiolipin synthase-like enzyme
MLIEAGVKVYVDNFTGLMHNNYIVLYDHDGPPHLVITGSYNFSAAAEDRNFDNIVIMNSWPIMQKYADAADEAIQMGSPFEGCEVNN